MPIPLGTVENRVVWNNNLLFTHSANGLDVSNWRGRVLRRMAVKRVGRTYQNCRKLDPILSSSSDAGKDLALVPLCGSFDRPRFLETGRGTLVVVAAVVVFLRA